MHKEEYKNCEFRVYTHEENMVVRKHSGFKSRFFACTLKDKSLEGQVLKGDFTIEYFDHGIPVTVKFKDLPNEVFDKFLGELWEVHEQYKRRIEL